MFLFWKVLGFIFTLEKAKMQVQHQPSKLQLSWLTTDHHPHPDLFPSAVTRVTKRQNCHTCTEHRNMQMASTCQRWKYYPRQTLKVPHSQAVCALHKWLCLQTLPASGHQRSPRRHHTSPVVQRTDWTSQLWFLWFSIKLPLLLEHGSPAPPRTLLYY